MNNGLRNYFAVRKEQKAEEKQQEEKRQQELVALREECSQFWDRIDKLYDKRKAKNLPERSPILWGHSYDKDENGDPQWMSWGRRWCR